MPRRDGHKQWTTRPSVLSLLDFPYVVLAKANTKSGSFAALGNYAAPTSGSVGPTRAPCQPAKVKRGYDTNLAWSKKEIIYVEGSDEPVVSPGMSLDKLCNQNRDGGYLVVIASLRKA